MALASEHARACAARTVHEDFRKVREAMEERRLEQAPSGAEGGRTHRTAPHRIAPHHRTKASQGQRARENVAVCSKTRTLLSGHGWQHALDEYLHVA